MKETTPKEDHGVCERDYEPYIERQGERCSDCGGALQKKDGRICTSCFAYRLLLL